MSNANNMNKNNEGIKNMSMLTKTKYLLGNRCIKSLYMHIKHPERSANYGKERDFSALEPAYEIAKSYYPGCITVDTSKGIAHAIVETRKLLESGCETIYNAVFCTDTNEMCIVRLMHRKKNGSYDIHDIQIKQPNEETREKKIDLDGVAYIYQVVKRCGIKVSDVFVMHINSEFVKHGEINPREFYKLYDVTTQIYDMQPLVIDNIEKCWDVINSSAEIDRERDYMCIQPKSNSCEFSCHCFKDIPEKSILDISRFLPKKALPLIDSGIVTISDLARAGIKVTALQKLQVETEAYDLPPTIDVLNLKECLSKITYPLYHLDFESFYEPVPQFDGEKPWQQVPFQFSLHVQNDRGTEPIHYEYLAEVEADPRRKLAEALCQYIPKDVCVTAYHMQFERDRITELAEIYPDLKEHLLNIRDNIQDLEIPFSKKYYYCKEFEGKSSIKKVLPALCPGDKELSYASLEGVHKGDEASKAFMDMRYMSKEEQQVVRNQLLKYCCLDTLAMVKVLEKLFAILDRELGRVA